MEFKTEKRKFLMVSGGLLGSLPFINLLKSGKYTGAYYLYATMTVKNGEKQYLYNDMPVNEPKFDALDAKMFRQKKLLKICHMHIGKLKQWVWIYVFDNRQSFLEWEHEIEKIVYFH